MEAKSQIKREEHKLSLRKIQKEIKKTASSAQIGFYFLTRITKFTTGNC